MAQKPVDMVEIGTRTGERLMTKPEIRQIIKETRTARSGMGNGDPAIWALLKATDEEGNPDLERRAKGAELALDHLARLAPEGGRGQSLPEGVRLVVPLTRDEQPLGTPSG